MTGETRISATAADGQITILASRGIQSWSTTFPAGDEEAQASATDALMESVCGFSRVHVGVVVREAEKQL